MRDLNYDFHTLCQRNADGSRSTQTRRSRELAQIANELHQLGYRGLRAQNLKPRHVERLVGHWLERSYQPGTIKNRMAALRWCTEKLNKPGLVAADNARYGIPDRTLVSATSKAQTLDREKLNEIPCPYVRMSLELQAAFGLRREEAIKFKPSYADRTDDVVLKPSWTKGGRARTIPLLTEHQRVVLNRAARLAGDGSLIPPERKYVHQLKRYENQTAAAGLSKLHGLRHHYAQMRYAELTGRPAPHAGGKSTRELNADERRIDREARHVISRELGHERVKGITDVYLGR